MWQSNDRNVNALEPVEKLHAVICVQTLSFAQKCPWISRGLSLFIGSRKIAPHNRCKPNHLLSIPACSRITAMDQGDRSLKENEVHNTISAVVHLRAHINRPWIHKNLRVTQLNRVEHPTPVITKRLISGSITSASPFDPINCVFQIKNE
jgi:hypothetical protein